MAFPNPNPQPNGKEFQTRVFPLSDNDINHNLNNLDSDLIAYEQSRKFSLKIQIQLICFAIDILENENVRGSTLKDIRHCLCSAGLIDANDDLRRAMVMALKRGLIARPTWAVKTGLYSIYVKGDGIPIYAGRKRSKKSDGGVTKGRKKRKTKRRKKSDGGVTKGRKKRKEGEGTGGGRGGRRSYSSTDSCRSPGKPERKRPKRVRFRRRKRTSKQ